MDITPHPEHGFNCPVVWFGMLTLAPYPICFAVYPVWVKGFERKVRVLASQFAETAVGALSHGPSQRTVHKESESVAV
eukprot:1952653-Amphidinium_carterae.1